MLCAIMHDQPKHNRWLHIGSTLVYLVFAMLLLVKVGGLFADAVATDNVLRLALLALTPLAGYILADFASGFVHFLGDTFGNEHTPVVGKAFIYAFREHHVDKKAITRHDFFYTNGNNCLVSLPVMLVLYFAIPDAWLGNAFILFVYASLFFLIIGIFFTNQIHKWAHQDSPAPAILWMQQQGLILSPTRHELHHTAPFTSDYCITTGWLNPILGKLGFFTFAKAVLRRAPFMPKVDE